MIERRSPCATSMIAAGVAFDALRPGGSATPPGQLPPSRVEPSSRSPRRGRPGSCRARPATTKPASACGADTVQVADHLALPEAQAMARRAGAPAAARDRRQEAPRPVAAEPPRYWTSAVPPLEIRASSPGNRQPGRGHRRREAVGAALAPVPAPPVRHSDGGRTDKTLMAATGTPPAQDAKRPGGPTCGAAPSSPPSPEPRCRAAARPAFLLVVRDSALTAQMSWLGAVDDVVDGAHGGEHRVVRVVVAVQAVAADLDAGCRRRRASCGCVARARRSRRRTSGRPWARGRRSRARPARRGQAELSSSAWPSSTSLSSSIVQRSSPSKQKYSRPTHALVGSGTIHGLHER